MEASLKFFLNFPLHFYATVSFTRKLFNPPKILGSNHRIRLFIKVCVIVAAIRKKYLQFLSFK